MQFIAEGAKANKRCGVADVTGDAHNRQKIGLGTGAQRQYQSSLLAQISIPWSRGEAAWLRRSRDHRPPPAGEGASPEARRECPA